MPTQSYTIKEIFAHFMEDMNKKIDEIHSDVKEMKGDLIPRVSKLENKNSWLWGVMAATIFISGSIGFFVRFWMEQSVHTWAKDAVSIDISQIKQQIIDLQNNLK